MSFVAAVLRRPYTVVAGLILICLMGVGAVQRMPIDIFPEIDIPVVSVVWTYSGMSPRDMQNRILTLHERQLASLVDDISRLESTAYNGVGVLKVYLHQGADVTRAISQLSSSAQVILKSMPRNITPPLVLRYGATDVPIIQLSLSSSTLPDTKLNDLGQNIIRPDLAVVRGASIPYPYGGMPRVMMVDLDPLALEARGLSPTDVSDALQKQNVILPSGDVKIGDKDYSLVMNNSPDLITAINRYPVKEVDGKMVFIGDVAHVHDGHQVQSNSVSVDGKPGALVMVRKTEGVSTLAVIDGVKEALVDIRKLLPADVLVKPIFDQSVFVKAALNSVIIGGLMAAGLTAVMILLFLGNWRLTLIILMTIPLSIVTATILMYLGGETLNTMTLGGFALAVGILVDNGTVVIENIERHLRLREPLVEAIVSGAGEVGLPTALSTLCICIVFVPIFLLQGTAKYLFSPLSVSVCLSLIASLALSFTLVPVMFQYLMRSTVGAHQDHPPNEPGLRRGFNPFRIIHQGFELGFDRFRDSYRDNLAYSVSRARVTSLFFIILMGGSLALFPELGRDFFPQVDAGQMRLHVRAPPATRIEETQRYFAQVERAIREIVGDNQIDVVLDNIGLPYSGINIALSDSATVGPMDGEVLVSLKKNHTPTAAHIADLRRELPKRFPALQFFFQPPDIVDQVLNFGQPAPIDVRVTGPDSAKTFALASKIARDLKTVAGVVDSHVFQVPDAPALTVNVDRTLAQQAGVDQFSVANNVLVTTNSSTQTAPNFWVNPGTGASYRLIAQMPDYRVSTTQDLWTLPIMSAAGDDSGQMLMNVSDFGRDKAPLATSQLNIRPVFDVNADVQGTDLASATAGVDKVLAADSPPESDAMKVTLSGQAETMRESYNGLFTGMALAVALVYLVLVINFQSWIDPLIVLAAVPFALSGVVWMLFITQTHMSIPALMGTLMCIGLTTANSILVITFANQRVESGDYPRQAAIAAGYTRLRPVLMTAGAMIIGMTPMALGLGEGGEQNLPLARAVIGGLMFATFATLIFVPALYGLLRKPTKMRAPSPLAAEREYAAVP
jgi:multidrug efflux pump subunit AcrB